VQRSSRRLAMAEIILLLVFALFVGVMGLIFQLFDR
jgi:hypothetical protein